MISTFAMANWTVEGTRIKSTRRLVGFDCRTIHYSFKCTYCLDRHHHTIIGAHVHRQCTQYKLWVGISNLIIITYHYHYLTMRRTHVLPFLAPLGNHDLLGKMGNSGRIIWQHYCLCVLPFFLWNRKTDSVKTDSVKTDSMRPVATLLSTPFCHRALLS
jgi:hypothetical protein